MKNINQMIQTDKQAIPELSLDEQQEIDHLLAHYPQAGGASIDALKVIQKHRGWVSDSALAALAEHMRLPLADLESVATFYNLIFRQPVGEVLLHPCDGISCQLMGYRDIHQQLKQTLNIRDGETTTNKRFTLISLPCLGACDKAPVMLVREKVQNTDLLDKKLPEKDSWHEKLQANEINKILKQLDPEQGGATE